MDKKTKLKKGPIIILVVVLLLFIALTIVLLKSCSKKEEVEVIEKQTSFIDTFMNNTNEGIDEKTKKKIVDFFDKLTSR